MKSGERILESIAHVQKIPFTKDDILDVIKEHPGCTSRRILAYLGYGVSNSNDRERLTSFIVSIMNATKKLEHEGMIKIIDLEDRRIFRATGGIKR